MIISLVNKALSVVLTLAILGNVWIAYQQSHTYVQFTYGQAPVEQVALAPALDMALMQPLPTHPQPIRKPSHRS